VRFTDPAAALYVNVQSESIESMFAMSTSHVPGAPAPAGAAVLSQARSAGSSGSARDRASRKRPREGTTVRQRTPAKVVERVAPSALIRGSQGARQPAPLRASAMRRPSFPVRHRQEESLFLPGSQMSTADKEALHASGLGDMDADEFNAMMEDEGEEVGFNLGLSDIPVPSTPPPPPPPLSPAPDSDMKEQGYGQGVDPLSDDIESEMGPTQSDESGKVWHLSTPCIRMQLICSDRLFVPGGQQAFRPLFDD
jgi:cell cycle checkpoint control protein RAD9A